MDKMTNSQNVVGGKRIYGVIKQWNETCADYADMGANVLKLLAHPDTDEDQVREVWNAYLDASKRMHLMRSTLEVRYPEYEFKI